MTSLLKITGLEVSVGEKQVLKDFSLEIQPGEVHFLAGPNGAGKSTLAGAIAGLERFKVTAGEILFSGQNLTKLSPDKRAKAGVFLAFQEIPEIPGTTVFELLEAELLAANKEPDIAELSKKVNELLEMLGLPLDYKNRDISGFSGGEKRKVELLQMFVLEPKLAILDEVDSGLDADSVKKLPFWLSNYKGALLIISHNPTLIKNFPRAIIHNLEGSYDRSI
ncbi:ATP-binding cassette domain-containing protein [Candidatus Saccharibacteria bacterium]|nr:ATP-binding cassette domain-containing protein [Candidatus Saccharibacteria bacterium]